MQTILLRLRRDSPMKRRVLDREYISASFIGQNLSGYTLSGVFIDVDFSGANLTGARLCGQFVDVTFAGANLRHAALNGDFRDVNFSQATMPNGEPFERSHYPQLQETGKRRGRK